MYLRGRSLELADLFCREARRRIENNFRQMFGPNDLALNKTAKEVLGSEFAWLEQGIVDILYSMPAPVAAAPAPQAAPPKREPAVAGVGD